MVMPMVKISAWPVVEHAERIVGLDRRRLVARHRHVEALGLDLLVAEVFHGLEIEQAVDGLGVGVRVAVVHLAPDGDAPLGGREREPHVDRDRGENDHHVEPVEVVDEDRAHEHELEHRRRELHHAHAQDEIDAARAALDDARKPARAPLEMEAQRQPVQMPERAVVELAHGMLADADEQHVAHLRQHHHDDAAGSISRDQHAHAQHQALRNHAARLRHAGRQPVGHVLERDRHGDRYELGEEQRHAGSGNLEPQIRPVLRPDHRQTGP